MQVRATSLDPGGEPNVFNSPFKQKRYEVTSQLLVSIFTLFPPVRRLHADTVRVKFLLIF